MSLIPAHLLETARTSPHAAAIRTGERAVTYGEMSAAMNFLAERLIVEGLRTGDRVVILLSDDIDCILATLGVIRSGGIAVPLPAPIEFSSIDAIARQCEPFCILTTKEYLLRYPLLRDKLSCQFVFYDELGSHQEPMGRSEERMSKGRKEHGRDRISDLMNLGETDGALLVYEEPFAPRRKGMLFTHFNLLEELKIIRAADPMGGVRRELVLHPVSEVLGLTRILHLLTGGGTVCLPSPHRWIEEIGHDLARNECTAISVGAATLGRTMNVLSGKVGHLGESIRHVEICGSSLSRAEKAQLLNLFPAAAVVGYYGASSAPRSAVLHFREEGKKLESSGRPASGVEISIRNGGTKPARRGIAGEVEIRGGHTMTRSWEDQQRAPGLAENHWMRNGDVGCLDEEGYLHILGGAEDFIHLAGGVISPFEVEAIIRASYPECEICVLGIPDPLDSGYEIAVLCYTSPGNRTIILSELSRALADQIKNNIPKIVYRIERFPHRGEMIHRKELRRIILDGVTMDEMP